jgi:hypothetical protein
VARKSYYEIDALFPLVEGIVRHLGASKAEELSLSRFDNARIELGYADAPEGRVIARRFRMSWSELASVATDPQVDLKRSVQARRGEPERKLRAAEVVYALRLVALRLGQDTVAEDQYRRERKKIIAESDRQARAMGLRLPNHDQIRTAVGGDRNSALKLAGMDEPPHPGKGVTREDVLIEAFLQFGTRLSKNDYTLFCETNNIAAELPEHLPAAAVRANEQLKEQGLAIPLGSNRGKKDYDCSIPVERLLHIKNPPAWLTRRRVEKGGPEDAFYRYYRDKDPNEIANWPDYDDYAREHGLPAKNTLTRRGELADYVEEAEDRLAEERRRRRSSPETAGQVASS